MNKATIQLDSVNDFGNRLTTPILDLPRRILAEFNTHKMISKNSASSRAIPFKKMLDMAQNNPFIPMAWMKEHSGMQGYEYFTEQEVKDLQLLENHLLARDCAIDFAINQNSKGLTKQECNRYLEPFIWHKLLASATEWDNFFALRAADGAEIHIQDLAYKLMYEMNYNTPNRVKAGDWHIPFSENIDIETLKANYGEEVALEMIIKIATARCARTSYNNFDGSSDYEKDIILHDNLVKSGHWSPMEHICRAMSEREFYSWTKSIRVKKGNDLDYYRANNNEDWYEIMSYQEDGYAHIVEYGWCANMRGWIQYRKLFGNENRIEPRLAKVINGIL